MDRDAFLRVAATRLHFLELLSEENHDQLVRQPRRRISAAEFGPTARFVSGLFKQFAFSRFQQRLTFRARRVAAQTGRYLDDGLARRDAELLDQHDSLIVRYR